MQDDGQAPSAGPKASVTARPPGSIKVSGLTQSKASDLVLSSASHNMASKLVIVMVGLPARGKSFIVKKLARYLNWLQHDTRIFNAGERRRQAPRTSVSEQDQSPSSAANSSAAFFDPDNAANVARRDEIALGVLDDLLAWITQGTGSVGILDATNSTLERRELVLRRIRDRAGPDMAVMLLESRCFDESILQRNFELKLSGPDYRHQDPNKALQDFKRRVNLYERAYVPLGEAEDRGMIPYVQVIDVGRKLSTHMIRGLLATQVVEYLLGFNLADRQLWLSCGGESLDDAVGRIGRHSDLSMDGQQYAIDLAGFIREQREKWEHRRMQTLNESKDGSSNSSPSTCEQRFRIWTSTMPQTIQTASPFPDDLYIKTEMKMLDDLNAGDMAGLTFEEISKQHPGVYAARRRDKMLYRWPGLGGEAYADLIYRLKPVILELERSKEHLLLISHRAAIRVLLAYLLDLRRGDLPDMAVPKNWAFLLEPKPYGIDFRAYSYRQETRQFAEELGARDMFTT